MRWVCRSGRLEGEYVWSIKTPSNLFYPSAQTAALCTAPLTPCWVPRIHVPSMTPLFQPVCAVFENLCFLFNRCTWADGDYTGRHFLQFYWYGLYCTLWVLVSGFIPQHGIHGHACDPVPPCGSVRLILSLSFYLVFPSCVCCLFSPKLHIRRVWPVPLWADSRRTVSFSGPWCWWFLFLSLCPI